MGNTKQQRSVERVINPTPVRMVGDGFRVHNFIPQAASMQRMDPFLILDYGGDFYVEPSDKPKGVGVHPHKGFETVTIAYKGSVEHKDSSGGGGIIHEGDVQWMTAANGVLHKEFHEKEFSKKGGHFQMVQLWVNLPSKDKKSNPKYQTIKSSTIQHHQLLDNAGDIAVIAGEYEGTKGVASTFTPVHLYNVTLNKGKKTTISFPKNYNTGIVVIEGDITVNETPAATDHFVLMKNDGDTFTIQATSQAKVLIMSGEPINEPIMAHGPFVMNTEEELIQAFNDFNTGKFGYME